MVMLVRILSFSLLYIGYWGLRFCSQADICVLVFMLFFYVFCHFVSPDEWHWLKWHNNSTHLLGALWESKQGWLNAVAGALSFVDSFINFLISTTLHGEPAQCCQTRTWSYGHYPFSLSGMLADNLSSTCKHSFWGTCSLGSASWCCVAEVEKTKLMAWKTGVPSFEPWLEKTERLFLDWTWG
jgi:hypothetical protein